MRPSQNSRTKNRPAAKPRVGKKRPSLRGESTPQASMRLNRFIASSGVTSRRKADALIDQGKVTINGRIVTELGVQVRTYADQVAVEGKIISVRERHLYLLLNKPKDTISTVKDEIGRSTVLDYVNTHERLYPVGRLDRNTTGVLLLTNDGDLTQRLTHPRYEIEREYHATLDKPLAFKDAEALAKGGVSIGGGNITPALYLSISKLDARDVVVVIKEGKYREVRRMFEKFGYEVKKLDRTMFAGITHTGMKRGDVRPLIPKEIRTLKRLAGLASEDDSFFEKRSSARPRVRTERSKPTPLAKKIAPKSKSAPPRKTASRSPVLAKKKK